MTGILEILSLHMREVVNFAYNSLQKIIFAYNSFQSR